MTHVPETEIFVSVSGLGGHFLVHVPTSRIGIARVIKSTPSRSGDA